MNNIYNAAKKIYWKMPQSVQSKLRMPARKLANYLRKTEIDDYNHSKNGDLSWSQFEKNILIHSNKYKGVFIQSPVIDWDVDLYQRPQHLANAFAKLGYLVIYCTLNWTKDNVSGFRQVSPNIWLTNYNVTGKIPDAIVSIYSTSYANADNIINAKNKNYQLIYEYIDHIDPQISGDPENIARLLRLKEYAFNGGADKIVASSIALYDEASAVVGADNVILSQNGVDTAHYRNLTANDVILPNDYKEFRKKYKNIVGYFGALAPWIWYDTVNEITQNNPDIGFIFIGPDYYGGSESLTKRANVLCTGAIDYKELPIYAREFDICLIPFEPGEIAKTTSPLKLFEYFALEKPVVVTSEMRECIVYDEVFRGKDSEELSKEIHKALKLKNDQCFKAKLALLADQNNWTNRAIAFEGAFKDAKQ